MTALLVVLLACAAPAGALPRETGTSAAEFLRLGAGARALGMGEAYAAVADGADAAYWNPAGLARLAGLEVAYARSELPAGLHHDFLAAAAPSRTLRGTVALAVTRLSQNSLDLVDANDQARGSFAPHSEVFALSYAYGSSGEPRSPYRKTRWRGSWDSLSEEREERWSGRLAGGLSLKAVREDLGTRQASAFAADGGLLVRPTDLNGLLVAGAFRNFGSGLRFISESEPLPAELAAGVSYLSRGDGWEALPAVEVALPRAGDPYLKMGVEASRPVARGASAAMRLGYNTRSASDLGFFSGIAAGVGLRVRGFFFDAAFQPMGALGQTFRLSLGWKLSSK